jgi:hypothetical protein
MIIFSTVLRVHVHAQEEEKPLIGTGERMSGHMSTEEKRKNTKKQRIMSVTKGGRGKQ